MERALVATSVMSAVLRFLSPSEVDSSAAHQFHLWSELPTDRRAASVGDEQFQMQMGISPSEYLDSVWTYAYPQASQRLEVVAGIPLRRLPSSCAPSMSDVFALASTNRRIRSAVQHDPSWDTRSRRHFPLSYRRDANVSHALDMNRMLRYGRCFYAACAPRFPPPEFMRRNCSGDTIPRNELFAPATAETPMSTASAIQAWIARKIGSAESLNHWWKSQSAVPVSRLNPTTRGTEVEKKVLAVVALDDMVYSLKDFLKLAVSAAQREISPEDVLVHRHVVFVSGVDLELFTVMCPVSSGSAAAKWRMLQLVGLLWDQASQVQLRDIFGSEVCGVIAVCNGRAVGRTIGNLLVPHAEPLTQPATLLRDWCLRSREVNAFVSWTSFPFLKDLPMLLTVVDLEHTVPPTNATLDDVARFFQVDIPMMQVESGCSANCGPVIVCGASLSVPASLRHALQFVAFPTL